MLVLKISIIPHSVVSDARFYSSGIVQRRTEPYANAASFQFNKSTTEGAAAGDPPAQRWSSVMGLAAPASTPRPLPVKRPAVALQLSAVLG